MTDKQIYDSYMAQGKALWQNGQHDAAREAWDKAKRIKDEMDAERKQKQEEGDTSSK